MKMANATHGRITGASRATRRRNDSDDGCLVILDENLYGSASTRSLLKPTESGRVSPSAGATA